MLGTAVRGANADCPGGCDNRSNGCSDPVSNIHFYATERDSPTLTYLANPHELLQIRRLLPADFVFEDGMPVCVLKRSLVSHGHCHASGLFRKIQENWLWK